MHYYQIIVGFVTQNPILKKTKTGKSVCTFSIAFNPRKNGEQPNISFIDIETWEKLADICSTTITKGKKILAVGTLRQDRWEDKDGKHQSKMKLVGNQISFLESLNKLIEHKEAV